MDPIFEAYQGSINEGRTYVYVGFSKDKQKQIESLNRARYTSAKKKLIANGIKAKDIKNMGAHHWNSVFVWNSDIDTVKDALSDAKYYKDLDIRTIKAEDLP